MEQTIAFSESERQAIDPEGLLKKFYEQHLKEGAVVAPAHLLPQTPKTEIGWSGSKFFDADTCRHFRLRVLTQEKERLLIGFLSDLAAACLFLGASNDAEGVFNFACDMMQYVVIKGKNIYGEIVCACQPVGSLRWYAALFGLGNVVERCKYVWCPQYSLREMVAVSERPAEVKTLEEAHGEIAQHLREALERRLSQGVYEPS